MTVAELVEALGDYGEHLDVVIVTPSGALRAIGEVGSENRPDGVVVTIEDAGHGPG